MNCPDCGAKPGELHLEGCDVERCAECGGQRLMCGCEHQREPLPWTGVWPAEAEAIELGFYCKWVEIAGSFVGHWEQCTREDPRARPDLNRLVTETRWNPVTRKRERIQR